MVKRTLRRRRHRGAAAVEFALVVPLLVTILLGTMEFGYVFFIQSSVAGAARVGVRNYAINWSPVAATDTAAQLTAKALAQSAVPTPADVTSQTFTQCTVAGGATTLTITYKYHSLTGLFDGLLGSNVTITGVGSMACGG